jgi:two-component system sensor histidine kinase BaeS
VRRKPVLDLHRLLERIGLGGIAGRFAVAMVAVAVGSVAIVVALTLYESEQRVRNPPADLAEARALFDEIRVREGLPADPDGIVVGFGSPPAPGPGGGEYGDSGGGRKGKRVGPRPLAQSGPTQPGPAGRVTWTAREAAAAARPQTDQFRSRLARMRGPLYDPRPWVTQTVLLGTLAAGAVAVVLALLLARRFARPVRAVSAAAARVAGGDLGARAPAPARGNDETASLARHFNAMAESLERQENERRHMIADIAHELRTPIAVMRARLEAIEDGVVPLGPEEVSRLQRQTALLARLVDDLRTLSLADAGRLSLERRRVDLAQIARSVATGFEARAAEAGVRVEVEAPAHLEASADPDRVSQVVSNLVDNAVRHTPRGGVVRVRLDPAGAEARLEVLDSGPGVPEAALPHVFDRFFRADEGRNRASGGSGLGLAIVRTLVDLHGGRVEAANHPDGGAVFRVTLPAT